MYLTSERDNPGQNASGLTDNAIHAREHAVGCSNYEDTREEQVADGGTERVTEEPVDSSIESNGTSSGNEHSEVKEMKQTRTIDYVDKLCVCSSSSCIVGLHLQVIFVDPGCQVFISIIDCFTSTIEFHIWEV
ncbi:hypothetical protein ElyMa_004371200 [Elysia marginata]|uniref:Uncharacterized protein n=1 Tax=Elysia marginata TaxID=1093978 RepID=A0AAV4H4I4_9GAST|nr:hypothetical protein ElyMa_004371200 [Elysia marginata]